MYNFVLEYFDIRNPLIKNQQNVSVIVLDEDDNLPEFKNIKMEKFVLSEDSIVGSFITRIDYIDRDQVTKSKIFLFKYFV